VSPNFHPSRCPADVGDVLLSSRNFDLGPRGRFDDLRRNPASNAIVLRVAVEANIGFLIDKVGSYGEVPVAITKSRVPTAFKAEHSFDLDSSH